MLDDLIAATRVKVRHAEESGCAGNMDGSPGPHVQGSTHTFAEVRLRWAANSNISCATSLSPCSLVSTCYAQTSIQIIFSDLNHTCKSLSSM